MTKKLQDAQLQMETQLNSALAALCTTFDARLYSKLLSAYTVLGKTQVMFIKFEYLRIIVFVIYWEKRRFKFI